MELLTSILFLLVFSRILGQIFKQVLGQPEVVGEILAGVILGGAMLGWVEPSRELAGIAELAVFLVIFYAGLEMEVHEVVTAMKGSGLPIAILGFLTPLVFGVGIGYGFDLGLYQGTVLGLCLAITALPVALRLLENMNLLETRLGHNVVGAAIIIDIVALVMLGIVLDQPSGGSSNIGEVLGSVALNGLKMLLFFVVVMVVDWVVTNRLKKNIFHDWLEQCRARFGDEALFGVAVLFVMLFSSLTESMGFHFVIGAFFGGLLLSKDFVGKKLHGNIQSTLNSIAGGFLAPIFFAYIGLQFSTRAFDDLFLLITVIVLGMVSKTVGAWLGGRLAGVSNKECLAVGFILNGRGVMDLVVAEIALERGIIGEGLFSALVLLSILSTFLSPLLFKRLNLNVSEAQAKPVPS